MKHGNGDPDDQPDSTIDWQAVRRALKASQATLRRIGTPSPAEVRRVLKARARSMAQVQSDAAIETVAPIEVVEFRLAGEAYAIESRYVQAVHALTGLTPLPCTPAYVLGIVNLRGEILSVIDIGSFFELPGRGEGPLDQLIALDAGAMRFGILAEDILGVRRMPMAAIQPTLPHLMGGRGDYLKGVTTEGMALLDVEKLTGDETLIIREQVG